MAVINFLTIGPRTYRMESDKIKQEGTSAVYNTCGFSAVETYDDVEYVTSVGVYARQDNAGDCKRARDAYEANERSIRLAAEKLAESKDKEATPTT